MKKVIYSKYSNERNHCLAIRTDILQDEDGVRYVQKLPEFPESIRKIMRCIREKVSF